MPPLRLCTVRSSRKTWVESGPDWLPNACPQNVHTDLGFTGSGPCVPMGGYVRPDWGLTGRTGSQISGQSLGIRPGQRTCKSLRCRRAGGGGHCDCCSVPYCRWLTLDGLAARWDCCRQRWPRSSWPGWPVQRVPGGCHRPGPVQPDHRKDRCQRRAAEAQCRVR